jgi:hypothetical protein
VRTSGATPPPVAEVEEEEDERRDQEVQLCDHEREAAGTSGEQEDGEHPCGGPPDDDGRAQTQDIGRRGHDGQRHDEEDRHEQARTLQEFRAERGQKKDGAKGRVDEPARGVGSCYAPKLAVSQREVSV